MATGITTGDVLVLEAAPETSCPWMSSSNAEIIDALPYIDDDYGNPAFKAHVDRLIEDEMRRSAKKPSDFLGDLPFIPSFNFESTRAGKPPGTIDFSRYAHLDMPPANKMNEEGAWKQALLRAHHLLQHQLIKLEN